MSDIICINIDAETDAGSALAKKYGVRGYPALLFLNSDSSPRDVIGGYMRADPFLAEVRRIESGKATIPNLRKQAQTEPDNLDPLFALLKKLEQFNARTDIEAVTKSLTEKIESGIGYDAKNLDSVFALYQDLQRASLKKLADAQAIAMQRLDPECKSLALRRLKFESLVKGLHKPSDLLELREFLKSETYDEVLFDGWYAIYSITNRASMRKKETKSNRIAYRKEARAAAVKLWKHTPVKHFAMVGNTIAWGFYEDVEHLSAEEKAWALKVAKVAVDAGSEDANIVDTYACCLFINGKVDEALKQVERCIELAPDKKEWRKRKASFMKGQG